MEEIIYEQKKFITRNHRLSRWRRGDSSDEKAAEYYDEVEKQAWTAFSMANDWKTIYGDGVKKTELSGTEKAS